MLFRQKIIFCVCFLFSHQLYTQHFHRADSIKVKSGGNFLKHPWVGGHNYCQFSELDINQDGIKDLFVFDRTGHKVTTYINGGTLNQVDYYDSTFKYASKFPHMEDWALIRDYNCDGKPDIMTYGITVGGIKVWRNTSSGGNLQFTLQTPYIQSNYNPSVSNLYVSRVDLPSIDDIDGDGDLDVLTFDFASTYLEFHINKSIESGYGCDSLIFQLDPGCWGNFTENLTGCDVNLGMSCRIANYDSLFSAPAFRQNHVIDIPENTSGENLREQHAGNCSMCIDEDGDGDKDVFLGQLSCCSFVRLQNGGTASSANMTAMDDSFPSYNIPAILNAFPCGFYVDVDNDDKRDLVIAPNTKILALDYESIWYYKNTGTDSVPVFERQTRNLFEENMIDVGSGADPVFFDYNQDGLTDILITNYSMIYDSCTVSNYFGVRAYKNIGSATNPVFDFGTDDFNTIDAQLASFLGNSLTGKHLTFGDMDGDGDEDMFTGDFDGKLHYFSNTAGAGNPVNLVLTQTNYTDNISAVIDVGNFSMPQLIDADRDGDLDLLVGERAGNINYFENIGTPAAPSYSLVSQSFGGVDVLKICCTGYSVPFMYDSAGSYHLLIGSEASRNYPEMGWIWHYKNIDGNLNGTFTLVDSMYQNIWEGERMCLNGTDITNDGRMDLVIGNYCGGITLYLGDTLTTGINELENNFDFSIYPNPSSGQFRLLNTEYRIQSIEVYTIVGEQVYRNKLSAKGQLSGIINLSEAGNGIYLVKVSGENFSATKKLIIFK